MVIYALAKTLFGIVNLIINLFPDGPAPAFMLSAGPLVHDAFAAGNGLGAWVPWVAVIGVAGVIFTLWLVLTAISAMRWLIGWVPTMGGS